MAKVPRLLAELVVPAGWEETLQFLAAEAGLGTMLADWSFPSGAVGPEAALHGRAADRLALLLDPAQEDAFRAQAARWAADFGWAAGEWSLRVAPRDIDDDAEAWKRHWRPFRCAGFELRAAFHDPAAVPHRAGCVPLVIATGSAFGTGSHATTRAMLRGLRAAHADLRAAAGPGEAGEGATGPAAMLDVGTGTGILAVAAALLGVPRVAGMDPDAESPAQAARTAAANGVADRCRFWRGRLESAAGAWPLVCANLVADLHELHAEALVGLTAPGGRLLAGGIREDRLAEVQEAFERAGTVPVAVLGRGRWRGLDLARPPALPAG